MFTVKLKQETEQIYLIVLVLIKCQQQNYNKFQILYFFMELDILNKSVVSSQSGEDRASLFTEINELRALAQKQIMKNQIVYNLLLDNDIFVNFKPYLSTIPKVKLSKDNEIESEKQRLIYLNDLVLSQAHQLEKYKYKYENKLQELKIQKQQLSNKVQSAYLLMRKAWYTQYTPISNDSIPVSAESQLEKLNKIVLTLKNNAQKIIIQDRKSLLQNYSFYNNKSHIQQLLEIDCFTKLKEKYERTMMAQQDPKVIKSFSSQNISKQAAFKKQSPNYQQIISNLQKQNQTLKDQIHESQKKIKKLENELIKTQSKLQQISDKLNKLAYQNQQRQKKTKILCKNDKYKFEIALLLPTPFQNDRVPIETHKSVQQILRFLSEQQLTHNNTNPNVGETSNSEKQLSNMNNIHQSPSTEVETDIEIRPRKQSRCANRTSTIQFRPEDITQMKFRRTNTTATIGLLNYRLKKEGEENINMNFYTKMEKLTEQE